MSTQENLPTYGDPKTDIVSDSMKATNEIISEDLSEINAYIENPDNMNNLTESLKDDFGTDLESQLTTGDIGLHKITLLAKSTTQLEKELNTKKTKIAETADQKTKDELTLDISGLSSLKKLLETSLKNNTTITKHQNEIEKKLLKLQRGIKGVDKDDINVKYKSITLNENNIPTFKYNVAGETVIFELKNNKINISKGNIKIDDIYYKINDNIELEKDTEGKLNELKDYKSEGGKFDIIKVDNGFEATFTLKDSEGKNKTTKFNLNQDGLPNSANTRTNKEKYNLTIDQKTKTFKITDLNSKKAEVTETKQDSDEIKNLKKKQEKINGKTTELTDKDRATMAEIDKKIEKQEKIEKELDDIDDKLNIKKERLKKLDDEYRTTDSKGREKINLEIKTIKEEVKQIEKREDAVNKEVNTQLNIKTNNEFLENFTTESILKKIENNDWYKNNEEISKIKNTTELLSKELDKNLNNDKIKKLITSLKVGDIKGFQKTIYEETKYESKYKNPLDGNLGGETFIVLEKYIKGINSDETAKNTKEGNTFDIQKSEVPKNENTIQLQEVEKKNNKAKAEIAAKEKGNTTIEKIVEKKINGVNYNMKKTGNKLEVEYTDGEDIRESLKFILDKNGHTKSMLLGTANISIPKFDSKNILENGIIKHSDIDTSKEYKSINVLTTGTKRNIYQGKIINGEKVNGLQYTIDTNGETDIKGIGKDRPSYNTYPNQYRNNNNNSYNGNIPYAPEH